jgi:hypothetical protein
LLQIRGSKVRVGSEVKMLAGVQQMRLNVERVDSLATFMFGSFGIGHHGSNTIAMAADQPFHERDRIKRRNGLLFAPTRIVDVLLGTVRVGKDCNSVTGFSGEHDRFELWDIFVSDYVKGHNLPLWLKDEMCL